ncbi:hypothetical protein CPB84DRAFT_709787 [Gymnopilus junonius]|uniref:F-box domain-containing protein n=1 Tax=Gymnopilus junonius TaxID=109634 RepID=A0A9P5TQL8_GYMJU|nr:hypothetical protein CPB84DRAFT_709787 [Gymnopilus junonius]
MSTVPPSHHRLPPELISLIFDSVGDSRDWLTLKNCSLVSHTYLPQVRRQLFAVISLHLRSHPNPIVIRDVVRRMKGLCDFLQRDPDASRYVKTLKVLDSYPVYDSEWITQQTWLPVLLDHLHHVRYLTFGCEVGYLQWSLFSHQLQYSLASQFTSPQLLTLTLCNLGSVPSAVLTTSVRYMYLNNITTIDSPEISLVMEQFWQALPLHSRLACLQLRTVSMANTNSAWGVLEAHADKVKLIKWRCWEGVCIMCYISTPISKT